MEIEAGVYYIVERNTGILKPYWEAFMVWSHGDEYPEAFETQEDAEKFARRKDSKTYPTRVVRITTTREIIE